MLKFFFVNFKLCKFEYNLKLSNYGIRKQKTE